MRGLGRSAAILLGLWLVPGPALSQAPEPNGSVPPHLARFVLERGPVKALRLPEGWVCSPEIKPPPDVAVLCRRGPRPSDSVLTVTVRRQAPGEITAAFHTIPNSITFDSVEPGLLPDEIRAVSLVLGPRADNQYRNPIPYPNAAAPSFHVAKMQFIAAAGRLMIKTEGRFMTPDGQPRAFDQSVVSQSAGEPQTLDDIDLATPEPVDPAAQRALFQAMVETIVWRP